MFFFFLYFFVGTIRCTLTPLTAVSTTPKLATELLHSVWCASPSEASSRLAANRTTSHVGAMFSRFADHHSDCRHRRRRLWLCRWFTKVSVDLHSITSCTLSTQTIYTQLPAHISLTRDSSHCTFSPAAFLAHLQWASSILGSSTVTARQLKHIISGQFNLINRHYLWGQRTENWTHSK